MKRLIAVFGSSGIVPGNAEWELAETWGRVIGEMGFGVASGGYHGAMEAISKGCKDAGGFVVGVTAPQLFPDRPGPNPFVDLEIPAPSLHARIETLCDATVATLGLPGGVGTLAEILIAWNLTYIAWKQRRPMKPVGIHPAWQAVLRPAVGIEPKQTALLAAIADADALADFLRRIEPIPDATGE